MLVIAGHIRLDPARRDQAVAAAVEMMRETRQEKGCQSYVFSEELGEPGCFRIFEEWDSQAALDAHFAAPHMATFQTAMAGFGITEMAVQKYEVAAVGPVR